MLEGAQAPSVDLESFTRHSFTMAGKGITPLQYYVATGRREGRS